MNKQAIAPQRSRSELETENEANRLMAQVQAALDIISTHSPEEDDSLESAADRIERAARDLADAIRGVAQERKSSQ